MDVSQPFNSCSRVILNCGNITSWNKMKKKVLLTSTQELSSSLENTLISSHGNAPQSPSNRCCTCVLRNMALCQTIKPEERDSLRITLKVFICAWDGDHVTKAINTSLSELGLLSVDSIVLSFPVCPSEELTLDKMKPVWLAMERAANEGKMEFLGTSDLNMRSLKQLFEWATVKPRINQMNLAHCCTIPKDLVEYCKEVNIRLLTHNDEKCILPVDELHTTLASSLKMSDVASWQNSWVTRYHAVVDLRGIVSHKGYIMELANGF